MFFLFIVFAGSCEAALLPTYVSAETRLFLSLCCALNSASLLSEYAEKYQELLEKQDYFHEVDGENGNEE